MYETQEELDAFFEPLFQFKPVRKLGEGAFGLAVLVYDDVEEVHKVFKLPRTRETTEALQQEGANLRKLSELLHPNIIRLHQYGRIRMQWQGEEQERFYLNMAYGGTSLRERMGPLTKEFDDNSNTIFRGSRIRLPVQEALRITIDVAQGLEAAHGFKGAPFRMIHRDIKPDNILIDEQTGIARITDFGISRIVERTTALASFGGTPLYMEPECFLGRASLQSDIYSLGFVLHEMLAGELPFANIEKRFKTPPPDLRDLVPDIPPGLAVIVLRALQTDVDERYGNVMEFLADLRRIHANLNPLPTRYTQLSAAAGGQLLCDDTENEKRVTVRLVHSATSLREMAQADAQVEELKCAELIRPTRIFRHEQFLGIVHSARSAQSLSDVFASSSGSDHQQIAKLCQAIQSTCRLLTPVHEQQIPHGLLSPYCIFVREQDVEISDLALAPFLRSRHFCGHSDDSLQGWQELLPFCSPQILDASALPSVADDVFSIGAILFYLLTGQPAIGQEDREQIIHGRDQAEEIRNPRRINPLIPESLAAVMVKALQWNPIDRHISMKELLAAFEAVQLPDDIISSLLQDALETYPEDGSNQQLIAACRIVDRVLQMFPGNTAAHRTRGEIYFRNRAYAHAADEFEKVSRVHPDGPVFKQLGRCLLAQKVDSNQAIAAFKRALSYGEEAELLALYATSLARSGRHAEAIVAMQRSIDTESDDSRRESRLLKMQAWRQRSSENKSLDDTHLGGNDIASEASDVERPSENSHEDQSQR